MGPVESRVCAQKQGLGGGHLLDLFSWGEKGYGFLFSLPDSLHASLLQASFAVCRGPGWGGQEEKLP